MHPVLAHFAVSATMQLVLLTAMLLPIAFGGVCIDTISGQVTNPGATITALTAATGDTFAIRNGTAGKRIFLLQYWAGVQTAGVLEIKSPRMHDNVRAIRERIFTTDVIPYGNFWQNQLMYPQDNLTVSLSGGGAGKIEQASLLLWYEDLPGIAARLTDIATLQKSGVQEFQVEVAITPGVLGNYSGQAAINALFDTYIANTDYALVGMKVDTLCRSACLRGPDTGNVRVSVPGSVTMKDVTGDWFTRLTQTNGMPLIPVINSANKFGTFVDVLQSDGGAATNVTLMFVEMAPGAVASGS